MMDYARDRLKSGLWVQAQIRICGRQNLAVAVCRKGDADAGSILLKLNRLDGSCLVLNQSRTVAGEPAWSRGAGGRESVSEAEADAYIEKQVSFDPDIWVIEIEDPDSRYEIDGEII